MANVAEHNRRVWLANLIARV